MRLTVCAALLLCSLEAMAQDPPPPIPTDTTAFKAIVVQAGSVKPARTGATVRARLRTNDGRVLVQQGTTTPWLADSAREATDSSIFAVTISSGTLKVQNAAGKCLSTMGNEAALPLCFVECDKPLAVYPGADARIISGQAGFWLLTRYGPVGPTAGSPLLMPRSRLGTWFWIEPVP